MIRQYLSDIQLTMKINFISSKDSNKTSPMYIITNNIEIMIDYEKDEIIKELLKSVLKKYQ